jgi:hypothetical protein
MADASRRLTGRRHGEHDDAERDHRQPYEFEYQTVHGDTSDRQTVGAALNVS